MRGNAFGPLIATLFADRVVPPGQDGPDRLGWADPPQAKGGAPKGWGGPPAGKHVDLGRMDHADGGVVRTQRAYDDRGCD